MAVTDILTGAGSVLVLAAVVLYLLDQRLRCLGCVLLAAVLGVSVLELGSCATPEVSARPLFEVVASESSHGEPVEWIFMSVLVTKTMGDDQSPSWNLIGAGGSELIWGSEGPARWSSYRSIDPVLLAVASEFPCKVIKLRSRLLAKAQGLAPARKIPDSDWYYASTRGVSRSVETTALMFLVPLREGDEAKECSAARFSELYGDKVNSCLQSDPDFVAQVAPNRSEPYLMPLWSMFLLVGGLSFLVGWRHRFWVVAALLVLVPLAVLSLGRVAFEASRERLESGVPTTKDYRDLIQTRYFADEALTALFDRAASKGDPSLIGPALLALGCRADQRGPSQLVTNRIDYRRNRTRRYREYEALRDSLSATWLPLFDQIYQH